MSPQEVPDPIVLRPRRGDVVVSSKVVAHIDRIVQLRTGSGGIFMPGWLLEYLHFLELVVTADRVLLVEPRYSSITDQVVEEHSDSFTMLYFPAGLSIRESALARLEEEQVAFSATAEHPTTSPEREADLGLRFDPVLQSTFQKAIDHHKSLGAKDEDAHKIATAEFARDFGRSAFIAQCARHWGLPHLLSAEESEWAAHSETVDQEASKTVIGVLKDRLDTGARSLLKELAQITPVTHFPDTPIAATILSEARSATDLVLVALELRRHYAGFRGLCSQIQTELLSQDVSLKRRLVLLREIESLADSLWRPSEASTRKIAAESSAIVGLVSVAGAAATVGSLASLAAKLLSFPSEQILGALRRRKVRLLIQARNTFLSGTGDLGALARKFDVDKDDVQVAWRSWRLS